MYNIMPTMTMIMIIGVINVLVYHVVSHSRC